MERARQSRAGGGGYHKDGIPAGQVSGGDARTSLEGKRAECIYAFDGRRRDTLQANRRIDCAARGELEARRAASRARRKNRLGEIWFASGCLVAEGRGDIGEIGR